MTFTEPGEAFGHLVKTIKEYWPQADCESVRKAYELAGEAHKDQKRVRKVTAQKVIVSEAGASVYSASELAAQEFPGRVNAIDRVRHSHQCDV